MIHLDNIYLIYNFMCSAWLIAEFNHFCCLSIYFELYFYFLVLKSVEGRGGIVSKMLILDFNLGFLSLDFS